jgi:hypothetical protein
VRSFSEKEIFPVDPSEIFVMAANGPIQLLHHEVAVGVRFPLIIRREFDARKGVKNGRIFVHANKVGKSVVGNNMVHVCEEQPW